MQSRPETVALCFTVCVCVRACARARYTDQATRECCATIVHLQCTQTTPWHTCLVAATAACAACPVDPRPYCVATPAFGPRTFANCCFAKCNGVMILKDVLHGGSCRDTCKSCNARLEQPVCCSGTRTYKNGCYATCNGESGDTCSPGRCSSGVCGTREAEWGGPCCVRHVC